MRDRLKKLVEAASVAREAAAKARDAASKAVVRARNGPADALRNVTEGMLKRAAASGLPPEVATAGSAVAAGLWTKVSPDDPLARARLAEALVRDGQPIVALTEIAIRDGDASDESVLAQAWLARAAALTEHVDQVEERIDRALALLPATPTPAGAQARGVLASAALDALLTGLAERVLGPASEEPHHQLARGRLALIRGEHDVAAEALGAAARASLEEATAWRGVALAVSGQPRQAVAVLEPIRTRGPERAWIDLAMGWLRLLDGKPEAKAWLDRSAERPQRNPAALFLLGLVAERSGEIDAAKEAFLKAAKLASAWPDPWIGVVRTSLRAGDYAGARAAAQQVGSHGEDQLLTGLALGLSGDAEGAEAIWQRGSKTGPRDRERLRDVALLRGAVAWRLVKDRHPEAAAVAWRKVAASASNAGSSRVTLSRWAIDAARRCLEETQPPFYVIEAALGAAAMLRPESEDLVVAHCAASFLARGPAAARSALEAAVARGASDERITGLLALIDSATKGGPAPAPPLKHAAAVLDAAAKARAGDVTACLDALAAAEASASLTPGLKAVIGGARAVVELARINPLLRHGEIEPATEILDTALDHMPPGLDRDRVVHDLAAVSTIAARRLDAPARAVGEPPPQAAIVRWQEALGYWAALGAAPAYWADLARRVLEADDPRLSPRDVDALRASIHDVAAELPAAYARDAVVAGQRRRARAFVALVIGAPVPEEARRKALEAALSPLTAEAHRLADEQKQVAKEHPPQQLKAAFTTALEQITRLRGELGEAAPETARPAQDARDELALCLVSFFENLHDRAAAYREAIEALAAAADLAASETLRAELDGKLTRMRTKGTTR